MLRIAGGIALIVSLLLCTWLLGGSVAYGWILHSDHYGAEFAAYGKWTLGLAGGMTLAAMLYFLRRDLSAAAVGLLSYLPSLMILLRAMNAAERAGWAGQTEASFGRNAAEVWRNGGMWNAVTLVLLLLLALTRWFSYDAAAARAARRAAKQRAEDAPAPSILSDDLR